MEQRGFGPHAPGKGAVRVLLCANRVLLTARAEDMEVVELCHLLHGPVFWELDSGQYHGGNWIELVAEYSRDLCQSNDFVHRDVLQLEVRQCLPHWLSSSGAQCLRHVGKLLLRGCKSSIGNYLVRCPV
jgi:hypothetical protein